jgi:hypothetical protein
VESGENELISGRDEFVQAWSGRLRLYGIVVQPVPRINKVFFEGREGVVVGLSGLTGYEC